MADLFLSYSRHDGTFVRRLASALQERGKDVWVDVDGIRDAEVFPEALRRAIESSDAFVFVISPDAVKSSFCVEEVEHAAVLNKRIVPIALRPVSDEDVPEQVRVRNWIPAETDGGFDGTIERVVKALDTDLEWERQHSRLTVKALEWDQSDRDRSFLLRGADLRAAEQSLAAGAGKDPGPTALETEYVVAGRRAATRRQRNALAGSVGVTVISVGLLVFALISLFAANHARDVAKGQALTSDAESVGAQGVNEKNLDLAMLYAVAGVRLQNRLQTRSDLLTVLQDNPDAIRLLRPSHDGIEALAVDSTGRLLATGDSAGVVRFEDMSHWRTEGSPVRLPGVVIDRGMAFAPHGGPLGVLTTNESSPTPTTNESTNVNLYAVDIATEKYRRLTSLRGTIPPGEDPGAALAFSPDGGRVAVAFATAGPDGSIASATLRVLDVATGRVIWRRKYPLLPGQEPIRVQFARDGTLVTSGQQGGTLLWNGRTGRLLRRFPFGGEPAVSANGETAAVAVNNADLNTASSRIAVIDLRTGRYHFLAEGVSSAWVKSLAITPDGKTIVGITHRGDTDVWDAASGSISYTIAAPPGALGAAAVDPAVRTLLVGSQDGSVTAYDLAGSRRLGRAFQWGPPAQSCVSSPCFVINRQSNLMAATQGDGSVALIDLRSLRLVATLPAQNGSLATAVAFFPDGRTLVTGGSSGRLTVWDTLSHVVLRTVAVGAAVMSADVSPDGRLIAVQTQAHGSTGSVVQVRQASGGKPLWSALVPDGASGVYFSPNGREVAAVGCCTALSTVAGWDARSGRQLFRRRLTNHATAIAISPDSRVLGVGTENGQVLLWNAARGTSLQPPLQVATASTAQLSFSPDGKTLVVSANDGSTTLWDLRSRTQIAGSFPERPNVFTASGFAPDGKLVIVYLADMAEWPMNVGAWERYACRVAGRNLTHAEWRDILPDRPYMRVCPDAGAG